MPKQGGRNEESEVGGTENAEGGQLVSDSEVSGERGIVREEDMGQPEPRGAASDNQRGQESVRNVDDRLAQAALDRAMVNKGKTIAIISKSAVILVEM